MFDELDVFQGRYEKVQKIGEGGFANVFLCRDSCFKTKSELGKENLKPNHVLEASLGGGSLVKSLDF